MPLRAERDTHRRRDGTPSRAHLNSLEGGASASHASDSQHTTATSMRAPCIASSIEGIRVGYGEGRLPEVRQRDAPHDTLDAGDRASRCNALHADRNDSAGVVEHCRYPGPAALPCTTRANIRRTALHRAKHIIPRGPFWEAFGAPLSRRRTRDRSRSRGAHRRLQAHATATRGEPLFAGATTVPVAHVVALDARRFHAMPTTDHDGRHHRTRNAPTHAPHHRLHELRRHALAVGAICRRTPSPRRAATQRRLRIGHQRNRAHRQRRRSPKPPLCHRSATRSPRRHRPKAPTPLRVHP